MTPAERIATALKGHRIGRDEYRCCCPVHGDHDPSLDVRDAGYGRVLVVCRVGCAQTDVIKALAARNLWPDDPHHETELQKRMRRSRDELEARRNKQNALRLFEEAVPARRTLGQHYLNRRGLDMPLNDDVRFLPCCPRKGSVAPALVVLMRNYRNGEPQAIQRIYIDPKTSLKDRCLASPNGTMMLGPADGAAMMITPWKHSREDGRLYVCEGFETGCALMMRGRVPVWALGDAGRIARLPVLRGVDELVICADHDKVNENTGKRAGIEAAVACKARWIAESRNAVVVAPKIEGADYADIWGRHNGEAGREPARR